MQQRDSLWTSASILTYISILIIIIIIIIIIGCYYLGHSEGFDVLFSASLSELSPETGLDVATDVLCNNVPIRNTKSSKDYKQTLNLGKLCLQTKRSTRTTSWLKNNPWNLFMFLRSYEG